MKPDNLPRNDDDTLRSYTWPGGYTIYYLDAMDCALCAKCANEAETDNKKRGFPDKKYTPIIACVNYENAHLFCEGCSESRPPRCALTNAPLGLCSGSAVSAAFE